MSSEWLFLCVLLLGADPTPVAASVHDAARAGIEQHRKGDAVIVVQDGRGRPAPGMRVHVQQVSHDFRFGNYIRPRHYENQPYLQRFKEVFNFIQLLEFNWGQYEPDEGQPLLEPRMDFIHNWCTPNGFSRFYGHMLVWTRQYDRYPRTGLPVWLFDYDKARQYELLEQRIRREVAAYRDIDLVWDVVNEAVHCRVWGDWDKDNYVQNRQAEPLERVLPYVKDALTWAHDANPDARLLINDYYVIVKSPFQRRFKQLIDALLAQQVPLHAIGIQAHEPYKGKYWYAPQELWDAYELFGTQTGLPIYITEYWCVSDANEEIRGNHRSGRWSPQRQAEAVEEFYRISFGHPSIEAIVYFGLSDSDVVQPHCGLLDEQYQPKPAWERLKHLIWKEWITSASGATGPDGTFAFRGFHGRYQVSLEDAGQKRVVGLHLVKGEPNRLTVTLERAE